MSSHLATRARLALSFAALGLTACGSGLDAKAEPEPAASAVALDRPAQRDDCGTFERPCLLQEIRVSAAAAE